MPPPAVVRHDGDDSYLVVAADKGTAKFSDVANEVAASYGFWLGDAFASGGSVGYDHKAMGITARGAWESVKRHFRELGVDTQAEEFTVVGIGDMSGDVFGNGMLLSPPHPAGRRVRPPARLRRPRSRTPRAGSPSGSGCSRCRARRGTTTTGPRSARAAGCGRARRSRCRSGPRCARRWGSRRSVTRLSPPELIRAILRAPADLLWNGGIGTYVKASARDPRRRRRQGQRRDPGRRPRAAGQGRRRGRQPRADPARPHRVRPGRRQAQHRRDRQLRGCRLQRPRGQHQDPAGPARRGEASWTGRRATRCSSR